MKTKFGKRSSRSSRLPHRLSDQGEAGKKKQAGDDNDDKDGNVAPSPSPSNQEISIRKCTSASTVINIGRLSQLDDIIYWTNRADLQKRIDADEFQAYRGALHDEQRAGVLMVGSEEEGRVWIEILGVLPHCRRRGLARALIGQLIEDAIKGGHRAIFVDVDDDDVPANRFYKSVGFVLSGHLKKYYYDDSAANVYHYLLKPDHPHS